MGMGVKKVAKKGVDTATGFAHQKVHQVEKDNSGVEAAHKSEEAAERLHHFGKGRKKPKDKSARAEKRGGEDQKSSRLKFSESEGGTAENAAEPSLKKKQLMQLPLLGLMLSMLVGCSSLNKEPIVINVKPRVEPLSKPILQAMQPNSTELLKKADNWLLNSQQLLDSVMTNSGQ